MNEETHKEAFHIKRLIPLMIMVLLFLILRFRFKDIGIGDLLNFTPSNPYLAGGIIILIFAIKSVTMFVPLTIIYISSSIIFPLFWAIIINIIGLFVCMSLPYFIGRYSGKEFVEKLIRKYPKVKKIDKIKSDNGWMFVFMVKVLGFIPNEISSLLLGSTAIGYDKYIISSILAKTPSMLATTILGGNISDPSSPEFKYSILIASIIFIGIALITWNYKKSIDG